MNDELESVNPTAVFDESSVVQCNALTQVVATEKVSTTEQASVASVSYTHLRAHET